MNHLQTKTVRIEVEGRISRQLTLSEPLTLSEVWYLPEVASLGPHRMAGLGQDGVAYASIDSTSFEAWKRIMYQLKG